MNKLKTSRHYSLIATGIMVGSTLLGHAFAGDSRTLDEVVVTATRSATGVSDAPATVTVISAAKMATRNISRLGDALKNVPGLFLRAGALGDSQGTQGTSGMSMRGVDHRRILILLDGQPIHDAGSGQVNWRIPFVDDIEKIEVIPGAFSSLYGSNAVGGVINIISKQAKERELTFKVKRGGGDASGQEASLYFRNKTEQGLGITAGFGYQDKDSYINDFVVRTPLAGVGIVPVTGERAVTTSTGTPAYLVGDKGSTPWRQINATTKLSYDLSSVDKIFAGVSYSETALGYSTFNSYLRNAAGTPLSSGSLLVNGQRVTLNESAFVNNSPLFESATRYFAAYDGTWGSDKLLKLSLARIDRQYRFVNADTSATWASGTGSQTRAPNYGIDGEAQLGFPLGESQFLISGISLHREVVDGITFALANWRTPGSRTAVNSGYSGTSTTASIFVQDEVSISERLQLYAGGRYDDWYTSGSHFRNTAPASAANHSVRNASSVSAKLSGVYRASTDITLRGSYGQAFRAPSNNDLYAYASLYGITSLGDPNLSPEKSASWEFGMNWQLSETAKINTTLYRTDISDLITNYRVSNVPIVSQRINAGKARINGVELAVETGLTDWLNMSASYAYIDSRMLENMVDPLSVGKRLTDSPRNLATLAFEARRGAWNTTLDANYHGKTFSTAQNIDVVQGIPGAYDKQTRVNAKVTYLFSPAIKASLAVSNLLDERSYSFFLNPGRSVIAGMEFKL